MTNAEKTAIKERATKAVAGLKVHVYEGMSMFTDLTFSDSYVKMETNRSELAGGEPVSPFKTRRPADPDERANMKIEYNALYNRWKTKALVEAQEVFAEALKRLKAAKIRYRTGTDYGWPVARLA